MSNGSAEESASLEALSALVDGELDDIDAACACWHRNATARASWHAYHLISDVLRSTDLAAGAARDAAFLERLRMRLRAEPADLAEPIVVPDGMPGIVPDLVAAGVAAARPGADARRRMSGAAGRRLPAGVLSGRRRAWIGSAAVAAGFVIVAGGLVLTRAPEAPLDATLAQAEAPATETATALPAAGPGAAAIDGPVIRDARLDRYLAAHKQFAGSSALGLPSAFLRGASADRPAR